MYVARLRERALINPQKGRLREEPAEDHCYPLSVIKTTEPDFSETAQRRTLAVRGAHLAGHSCLGSFCWGLWWAYSCPIKFRRQKSKISLEAFLSFMNKILSVIIFHSHVLCKTAWIIQQIICSPRTLLLAPRISPSRHYIYIASEEPLV